MFVCNSLYFFIVAASYATGAHVIGWVIAWATFSDNRMDNHAEFVAAFKVATVTAVAFCVLGYACTIINN